MQLSKDEKNTNTLEKRCAIGQASIESLTLLGFVIMFSIPLIMLITTINSDDVAVDQAKTTVQILSDAVNTVYIQGDGSQKVVLVAYPKLEAATVHDSITIGGVSEIVLTVKTQNGMVDIVGITIAPIDPTSDLLGGRKGAGLQRIKVYYNVDKVRLEALG